MEAKRQKAPAMNGISFDESTHTYALDGHKLISVTQLLQKYGLSPDYGAVDQDTLKASADRGTLIHSEIEAYNKTGEEGFTEEFESYKKTVAEKGWKCLESEFLVHNDLVAGRADLLMEEEGEKVIADVKTTSSLHKDSVSWQLSLYAYLYGDRGIKRGQAFWFENGELKVVEIKLKPIEEVESLLSAYALDCPYQEKVPASDELVAELTKAETLIRYYDNRKKDIAKKSEAIKQARIKAMEDKGVYSFENDSVKVTYIAPGTRQTIDTAKLKKELPSLAEKFRKTTQVGAGIRVTFKEKED